jgi:hypothetical protein
LRLPRIETKRSTITGCCTRKGLDVRILILLLLLLAASVSPSFQSTTKEMKRQAKGIAAASKKRKAEAKEGSPLAPSITGATAETKGKLATGYAEAKPFRHALLEPICNEARLKAVFTEATTNLNVSALSLSLSLSLSLPSSSSRYISYMCICKHARTRNFRLASSIRLAKDPRIAPKIPESSFCALVSWLAGCAGGHGQVPRL